MQGNQAAVSPSPFRRHARDSYELDVFDATRYFSGGTDAGVGFPSTANTNFDPPLQLETRVNKQTPLKEKSSKKHFKQPVSPGVMLSSFFYSFFPQSSKKKVKDEKSLQGNIVSDERSRRSSSRRSSAPLTKFDQALWKQRLKNGESTKKMEVRAKQVEINGNESDSSSDLFELKSFAGASPSELPVFGSTTGAAAAGGFRRKRRSSSSHSVAF